jgi:hypothetical protein
LQKGGIPLFEKEGLGEILGELNSFLLCRLSSYHKGQRSETPPKKISDFVMSITKCYAKKSRKIFEI